MEREYRYLVVKRSDLKRYRLSRPFKFFVRYRLLHQNFSLFHPHARQTSSRAEVKPSL